MGSESGHTPGPWEVCGQFVRTPFRHGEKDAAGLMIADVRFGIWTPEQHEANARLIAAAPALFDALKAILSRPNRADITAKEWSAGLAALRLASSQGGDHA